MRHEAIVELFRARPTIAAELLRDALGVRVVAFSAVRIDESSFAQLVPTEYRADVVAVLLDQRNRPRQAIIIEVQLRIDRAKRFSWPLYTAALYARLRCPVCLLVVTTNPAVAKWASRPIQTFQPAAQFVPLVVGPELVASITDPTVAARAPERAVLSVMAHGRSAGAEEMALVAIEAAARLDDERPLS
jgi:hypothetical protein